jgi:Mitochondrial carrier protein
MNHPIQQPAACRHVHMHKPPTPYIHTAIDRSRNYRAMPEGTIMIQLFTHLSRTRRDSQPQPRHRHRHRYRPRRPASPSPGQRYGYNPASMVSKQHDRYVIQSYPNRQHNHLTTTKYTSKAGAGGGLVASIATCPLDVVKTKLQAQRTIQGQRGHLGILGTWFPSLPFSSHPHSFHSGIHPPLPYDQTPSHPYSAPTASAVYTVASAPPSSATSRRGLSISRCTTG